MKRAKKDINVTGSVNTMAQKAGENTPGLQSPPLVPVVVIEQLEVKPICGKRKSQKNPPAKEKTHS